jgi:5-methylcytosine-specific restriction endonuclease McrA
MTRKPLRAKYREKIFLKSQGKCSDCGEPCSGYWDLFRGKKTVFHLNQTHEIHHLIPVKFGGNNKLKNLILLCLACHKERHDNQRRYYGK